VGLVQPRDGVQQVPLKSGQVVHVICVRE
jgi:hypothetical protein